MQSFFEVSSRLKAKERKVILKQWAKREEQIDRVMHSTVVCTVTSKALLVKPFKEIEVLALKSLDAPKDEGEETEGKLFW